MAATTLGLYDLLAPEFLLGFNFPPHVDSYLSFARVVELHLADDEQAVIYTGRIAFVGNSATEPVLRHHDPSGSVLEWDDVSIAFRLTVPRQGAPFIHDGADLLAGAPINDPGPRNLFNALGPAPGSPGPSDYPGIGFRLELMFDGLKFHLGPDWLPGRIDDSGWVVPDTTTPVPAASAPGDVKIVAHKLMIVFERGQDPAAAPSVRLGSWGDSGFDAPSDLREGEVCHMEPPLALHSSGRFAFGIDTIALDLSPDHTPPEILEHFGVDDAWQGVYVKDARVLWSDQNKNWGFHIGVHDVLISFAGEVSMEGQVIVLGHAPNEFEVAVRFYEGSVSRPFTAGQVGDDHDANHLIRGSATMARDGRIQVVITGGVPSFTVHVTLDGSELSASQNGYAIPDTVSVGDHALVVTVDDSRTAPNHYRHEITLHVAAPREDTVTPAPHPTPAFRPTVPTDITWMLSPLPAGYSMSHEAAGGTRERIRISAPSSAATPSVTVDGSAVAVTDGQFTIDVAEGGATRSIDVHYAALPTPPPVDLLFHFDKPRNAGWGSALRERYVNDARAEFLAPTSRPVGSGDVEFTRSVVRWLNAVAGHTISLRASSSTPGGPGYNKTLSEHRLAIAQAVLSKGLVAVPTVTGATATGETGADATPASQRVCATISTASPAADLHATISRAARSTDPPPPTTRTPPPDAPLHANQQPPVFRFFGVRFRLERNSLVMGEFSLRLDFETELEARMRAAPVSGGGTNPSGTGEHLDLTDDGVYDFKLNVTWDTATRQLTETLSVAAAPNDQDGIARLTNAAGTNRLQNVFGGITLLLPVINSVAANFDPSSGGDWAELVGVVAVPSVLGALNLLQTRKWTWYGVEARARQNIPEGAEVTFTDFGAVFDYKVDFALVIDLIHLDLSGSVRYKAIGFNLHFEQVAGTWHYQPIFDTSRGYELALADPGGSALPAPLGDILRIFAARIARFNPLTLELDLGLKIDLGVVTVDRLKIKWPIDPLGVPIVLPTGVTIDIPNAILGRGYLDFDDGFEGTIDISIIPVKVRVAASLAVHGIDDAGRHATAVFASIIVEFPSPIVVGCTSLGIYGFSGLFAMHYKRDEQPRQPQDSVGPALRWLQKAEGQPAQLTNSHSERLWLPAIDRWSFGVGLIAGTLEGGTLINLTGTFVLELPGPRLLIFVKIQLIKTKPNSAKDVDVTVGILGVIDISPDSLTIGVIVDYSAKDLIKLRLPVEIFFNFHDGRDWHLDAGTIAHPAEALILNFVRASAYLMLHGDQIENFPTISGPRTLPGVAVALGIEASILLGDEGIGLYLRASAGVHVGVAFSPFYIAGDLFLEGELRIFIVSVEADARLGVTYPPTFVHGLIHGRVDLFFFSVEATIEFTLGGGTPDLTPPALVTGTWVQSHAPVLTAGQGGDRPIDASLGTGLALVSGGLPTGAAPSMFGHLLVGTSTSVGPGSLGDSHGGDTARDMPVNGYRGAWLRTHADGLFYRILGNTATSFTLARVTIAPGSRIPSVATAFATPAAGGYVVFAAVPIDSVPVLQMICSPRLDAALTDATATATFTAPLVAATGLTAGGWIDVSGDRQIRYRVTRLVLDPPLPAGTPRPPGTWRRDQPADPPGDASRRNQNIDLALFSRVPFTAERALERSTGLDEQVAQAFDDVCDPVAQPVCVLWTFCGQRIGPSGRGWQLDGKPQPDAPGTHRSAPPPTHLTVAEPSPELQDAVVDLILADAGLPVGSPARIVSVNAAAVQQPPPIDPRCFRALRLPMAVSVVKTDRQLPDDPELVKLLALHADRRWIELQTGHARRVTLFLAASKNEIGNSLIRVRQLDDTGAKITEAPLAAFLPRSVTGTAGLPATWIDPAGPWADDVTDVAAFLTTPDWAGLDHVIADIKPTDRTTRIRIALDPAAPIDMVVLVAAVEVCSVAEQDRAVTDTAVQDGRRRTLAAYLSDPVVPLLDPGTAYRLRIEYEAQGKAAGDADEAAATFPGLAQEFCFFTDDRPPGRLDPWVLGTTPEHEARYHFPEEPVSIVFNDGAVLSLFQRYGKGLKLVLRAAGGTPGTPPGGGPPPLTFEIDALALRDGELTTPFRDAVVRLVDRHPLLCIKIVPPPPHGVVTATSLTLQPLMAYTLDMVVDPEDPVDPGATAIAPLYRRSFQTSQFASAAALAADVTSTKIRHRALTAAIAPPAPPAASPPPVVAMTDQELEAALVAAGDEARPGAERAGITIYWEATGSGHHAPRAILIDAGEPLWRTRSEPRLEPVPDQDDPAYERIVPAAVTAMEVIETSDVRMVDWFIRSPGGTRTLVMLRPVTAAHPLQLALHRPASSLFALPAATTQLVEIPLSPSAPWEA